MMGPFAWPGGKRALTRALLELIPEHRIYIEAFAGSAKLLFAKEPSRMEVMNDLNGDVTNFFRVAKHRPAELAERLELECIHAGRFRELRALGTEVCELERALRYAYLSWYSFGAKGEHFASGLAKNSRGKRPLGGVRELLLRVAERLHSVLIEQRDFQQILDRYDAADSFFYLDPPYVAYQPNARYEPLAEGQRAALFDQLAALKGKFLLSFDDHPEIRERAAVAGFQVKQVGLRYSLGSTQGSRSREIQELLVANYKLS